MGAPRFVLDRFWPSNLFLGGIPGAWYDPTDLSTMFQDSTGTTPVTAVEQPVGRILDKSGNGNHASQSTAASRPTYRARYNALTQSEDFSQAVWIKTGTGTGSAPAVTTNAATAPDGTLTADSIVFNRGAGNAVGDQSSIAQAPTVSNATYTQTVWLKAATPADVGKQLALRNVAAASFVTVTLTADWVRYTRTETGSIANWEITNRGTITTSNSVTALVWGAQLLTAADVTATGNAYQRIAAATVYDTAAVFRPYLAFDGVDDSLSTAAINFTSTDKMTVFSGVTKSSDAADGVLCELTVNTNTNAGGFNIVGPPAPGYYFQVGAIGNRVLGTGTSFMSAAPSSIVMTTAYDRSIASSTSQIQYRINRNGPTSAGLSLDGIGASGAFANAALFIGRRNNTSFPFNGRLYELIVRGAASSVTEIADTELWVNARTGAY